jgi:hypothetical protein
LFSGFESWLVSSSSNAALQSEDLSNIMGRATLVNGFVATTAGVCRTFAECLLQTLRIFAADRLEPIGGMEQWGVPFTICCEWMPAPFGVGRNLRQLVRKLRRWCGCRHCAGLRGCFSNPTTGGGVEDCCSWCVRRVHSFMYLSLILM